MNREKIIDRARRTAAECRKRDRWQREGGVPSSLQSSIYKDCNSAIMSLLGLLGVEPPKATAEEDWI
ncbi:MAG: hypothetical protein NC131_10775 [Roseburia sp.]|nr:hypothetical protein [Roseburia sp.]